MKYYIGQITEHNGDFEYDTKYLFDTTGSPNEYTNNIAMMWRGGDESDWDEVLEGYWCDGTLIFDGGSKEVSQEDFEVLKKYLSIL
jgi:hypothetical protein